MSSPQQNPEIAPKARHEDRSLDSALRPRTFDEYIGQENIKQNLKILLLAAKKRGDAVEHLLFSGPAGLGKTTLAHLVALEIGAQIKITSGPAIEKVGDLASILTNLSSGDVLFIDEAHRLNKMIEEVLYPAMENRVLDIIIGKGPSARTIQLELPPFTLIAATTRLSLLSSPLRSRFSGGAFRLDFYTHENIEKILTRSAEILQVTIDSTAIRIIAERSRFTPRIANRLLKRARDYALVEDSDRITAELAKKALALMEIDEMGLEITDIKILDALIHKFQGGPVGVQTLAVSLMEEPETIEDVHEPYLIQIGFLTRTSRGRIATEHAYKHRGLIPPQNPQHTLSL